MILNHIDDGDPTDLLLYPGTLYVNVDCLKTHLILHNDSHILLINIQSTIVHFHNLFERYKSDIRKTCATINEVITKKSKKEEFPKYFFDKNSIITNDKDIVNYLNNLFINVGPGLSKSISAPTSKSYTDYLKESIAFSFEFKKIKPEYLLNIMKKIKAKASCGHDNISSILLKSISFEIHAIITLIIN